MKGWTEQKLVTIHIIHFGMADRGFCSICWVIYCKSTPNSRQFSEIESQQHGAHIDLIPKKAVPCQIKDFLSYSQSEIRARFLKALDKEVSQRKKCLDTRLFICLLINSCHGGKIAQTPGFLSAAKVSKSAKQLD